MTDAAHPHPADPNPADPNPADPNDPVLVRRAQIAQAVKLGKRIGYGLFALAMVVYFVGLFGTFTSTKVSIIVGSMIIGSIVLAPAIVFGYGVKAAIREERGETRSH